MVVVPPRILILSDDELLRQEFVVSDPVPLLGYGTHLRHDGEVREIEFTYDVIPPKNRVKPFIECSHCNREGARLGAAKAGEYLWTVFSRHQAQ